MTIQKPYADLTQLSDVCGKNLTRALVVITTEQKPYANLTRTAISNAFSYLTRTLRAALTRTLRGYVLSPRI